MNIKLTSLGALLGIVAIGALFSSNKQEAKVNAEGTIAPVIERASIAELAKKKASDNKVIEVYGRVTGLKSTSKSGVCSLTALNGDSDYIGVLNATADTTKLEKTDSGLGYYIGTYTSGQNFNKAYANNDAIIIQGIIEFNSGAPYLKGVVIRVDSIDDTIEDFATNALHMNDYKESLGYCKDSEHHYYQTAKAGYNQLLDTEKQEFVTNSKYEAYLNRYNAWAIANGDSPINPTTLKQDTKVSSLVIGDNQPIIITISVLAITGLIISGLYLFKRKLVK